MAFGKAVPINEEVVIHDVAQYLQGCRMNCSERYKLAVGRIVFVS